MPDHQLPELFWRDFLENHWEQRPVRFEQIFNSPFLSAEQLFDAVVSMPSTKTSGDRFWVSKTAQPVSKDGFNIIPLDVHGPRREDKSFDGFFSRVKQEHGNCPVGINIHHLEKASPDLWFRFRDFVRDLNRLSGELPAGRWDIDTFFGTYQTTPLGIHRDNASVFAMGVQGKRVYYTWPEDYFQPGDAALSTLEPDIIRPHLEHATRMELEPGDVVYWPSSNWHLVASDGSPSVVVSISAYFGEKLSALIASQVRHILETRLGDHDFNKAYTRPENPSAPPQILGTAHNALVETLRSGKMADALQQFWLIFRTAEGLHSVASNPDAALEPEQRIAIDPRYPVAWAQTSTGETIVSVNGLAFSISAAVGNSLIEMFKQLNSGQEYSVAQLVQGFAGEQTPATNIAETLNLLHRCRAFQRRGHA